MVADLSCVSVLITMGVLLGKLTPVQFLILAFMEASFAVLLEHILFALLHINDSGRSLVVHCFGAYFGLAAAKVVHRKNVMADEDNLNHSELFSMIGTLFLWIFFPSFNAATQEPEDARHRAIINTYLSIASCTTTTFMISSLSDHLGRFNMLHIQSSTLAGGISMGTVANVILYPHHAVLVGAFAGLLSVIGHVLITPRLLEKRLSLYDTCGVHNLHGLPGLLAGVFSVFFVLYYKPSEYGESIHQIYPYFEGGGGVHHGNRDQYTQAMYQLSGIVITLVMAVIGGLISGWVMNFSLLNQVRNQPSYEDTNYYLHAEFSLFGKLENGIVNEEFLTGTRATENGGSNLSEIKAVY